jgi:hypothetical protein
MKLQCFAAAGLIAFQNEIRKEDSVGWAEKSEVEKWDAPDFYEKSNRLHNSKSIV